MLLTRGFAALVTRLLEDGTPLQILLGVKISLRNSEPAEGGCAQEEQGQVYDVERKAEPDQSQ